MQQTAEAGKVRKKTIEGLKIISQNRKIWKLWVNESDARKGK